MSDNTLKAIEIVKKVRSTSWNFEKKEILEKAVKEFRKEGLSDKEIKDLFSNTIIKEQDNSMMLTNNSDYLSLLNEILNSNK